MAWMVLALAEIRILEVTRCLLLVGLLWRLGQGGWLGLGLRSGLAVRAALDQLVELAAIEPDAAAFRAVVDFYALALGHGEQGVRTDRALHGLTSFGLLGRRQM